MDPKTAHYQPPFAQEEQNHPGHESEMNPTPDFGEKTYKGSERLKGKVALITGADSGIGRAVALAYAREGADIAISYLNEDQDAEKTKKAVEGSGKSALLLPGDISDKNHCAVIVEQTVEKFGKIDILVNNAAFQGKSEERFEDIDPDRIAHTFGTNILSMFYLCRECLAHMQPGSSIINVSSIQAYQPSPAILDYATTKGAITTFTKGLSKQLIDRGIRVNSIAPGPVWTPLVAQSFHEEKISKFGSNAPIERPAQPAELAPSFVFLASEESRYVVGEVLGVTGGRFTP